MDAKVIVIIVLVVIIIALGVVSFVPFGDKKLFCPAAEEVEDLECPEAEECPTSNVATATSCASFVKAATSNLNVNLESYYTDSWCKTKYASISTESAYCKQISSNITAIVSSVAELFSGSKKLIKGSAGTTAIYYHDSEAEIASPSADLLTASAANATALASWGRLKTKSKGSTRRGNF